MITESITNRVLDRPLNLMRLLLDTVDQFHIHTGRTQVIICGQPGNHLRTPPFHDVPISFDPKICHTLGEFAYLISGAVHRAKFPAAFSVPFMSLLGLRKPLQAGDRETQFAGQGGQALCNARCLPFCKLHSPGAVRSCAAREFHGKRGSVGFGMCQARSSANGPVDTRCN